MIFEGSHTEWLFMWKPSVRDVVSWLNKQMDMGCSFLELKFNLFKTHLDLSQYWTAWMNLTKSERFKYVMDRSCLQAFYEFQPVEPTDGYGLHGKFTEPCRPKDLSSNIKGLLLCWNLKSQEIKMIRKLWILHERSIWN